MSETSQSNSSTDAHDAIARALARIPSGCAILTARSGNLRTGMLASWMQQAAFEPPMISVALKKGRPIERLIDESAAFVLNVLGENPMPMFKHFGRGFSLEEDAFAGLTVRAVNGGIEIDDQVARLSLQVRGKHGAGDHWLYLGQVTEAISAGPDAKPYVHIRKNGLSY